MSAVIVLGNLLLFIFGLVLLLKGSEYFVKSAASIAKKMGTSEFIIGLTLVAIGTSIPELLLSVTASFRGQSDIVIGNVVGSNIANIGLILGITAAMTLIVTRAEMLRRDGYMMLFAVLLFCVFIIDGSISKIEAVVFLVLYIAYMGFLFRTKPTRKDKYGFKDFIQYLIKFEYLRSTVKRVRGMGKDRRKRDMPSERRQKKPSRTGFGRNLLLLIVSGFAVVLGAHFVIDEAVYFAGLLNVPKSFVGVTVLGIGTSLPELSVSISATRRGHGNIAVGNIIGSSIANILLILGVSGMISTLSITDAALYYTIPFMVFMTVLLLVFIRRHWQLSRYEGIAFLVLYAVFILFLFFTI